MKSKREQKKQVRAQHRLIATSVALAVVLVGAVVGGVLNRSKDTPPELVQEAWKQEENLQDLLQTVPSEISSYLQDNTLSGEKVRSASRTVGGTIEEIARQCVTENNQGQGLLFGDYVDLFHNCWASIRQKPNCVEIDVVKTMTADTCEVRCYELLL